MIEIKNLRKSFNDDIILKDINITIGKGEIYGLVGKSGAGKSTLLRCINGLIDYDSGSLLVNGTDVKELNNSDLRKFRKKIGMVFQQFSLLDRLNVYDNVSLPMKHSGYDKNQIRIKVNELLQIVGLSGKENFRPSELSGGQKQRVAIARALTLEPHILLCDEATSALDPNTAKSILSLIKDINENLGLTVIVVAHQMNIVQAICNKMALLKDGELINDGTVLDIFLKEPKELDELLGEKKVEYLPQSGTNIRIFFNNESEKAFLFSDLAIQTGVNYRVVWGGIEKYREIAYSSFIINVKPEEVDKTINYLNHQEINWCFINFKK